MKLAAQNGQWLDPILMVWLRRSWLHLVEFDVLCPSASNLVAFLLLLLEELGLKMCSHLPLCGWF